LQALLKKPASKDSPAIQRDLTKSLTDCCNNKDFPDKLFAKLVAICDANMLNQTYSKFEGRGLLTIAFNQRQIEKMAILLKAGADPNLLVRNNRKRSRSNM